MGWAHKHPLQLLAEPASEVKGWVRGSPPPLRGKSWRAAGEAGPKPYQKLNSTVPSGCSCMWPQHEGRSQNMMLPSGSCSPIHLASPPSPPAPLAAAGPGGGDGGVLAAPHAAVSPSMLWQLQQEARVG